MIYRGVIEKYRRWLPVTKRTPVVTLLEGNTPLIPARALAKALGVSFEIFLKYEGTNPTGSFKDRGMTVAISKALEAKSKAVISASTGNTAASAAAYAARAGLKCIVVIPEGQTAIGKLSQSLMHGAQVLSIRGNFDEAFRLVKEIAEKYPVTLVNSVNPFRIEGQKTAAYEIVDALGEAPDYQFMPVGNAGNITAYWKGYCEYKKKRKAKKLPKMMGFQAEGAAPIVRGEPVKNPKTVASAIQIGNPASWQKAVCARDESGGKIDLVSDEEILGAYRMLGSLEGIFAEPASAASLAGLMKYVRCGFFSNSQSEIRNPKLKVVCILTGHGLKDPDTAMKSPVKPLTVEPDAALIARTLGL